MCVLHRASWLLRVIAPFAAAACGGAEPAGPAPAPPLPARVEAAIPADPAAPTDATPAPQASTLGRASPLLVVSEPDTLAHLERHGLDLGTQLAGARATGTHALAQYGAYRTLVETVRTDVRDDARRDRAAGVGMRHAHRQFDVRWLDSKKTRFELIAVVNRLDRKPFAPEHCGEVRLVYRLAYETDTQTGPVASRLPMTVNVVDFVASDGEGCARTARSWLRPPDPLAGAELAEWLLSGAGPLAPARRGTWQRKSVELNFQSVRWPSTVRPALGGHAEYVLRAFRPLAAAPFLEPMPLENTVDTARLAREPGLREGLTRLLRTPGALADLDAGTLRLPDEFLARRVVSVSPHGLGRRANRPFGAALPAQTFEDLDLSVYRTIASPAAALRRLDALSCSGCHQSRSIAGFHLLGMEGPGDRIDAVHVPMSPHFHGDLDRRAEYVLALAEGRESDWIRPPAERDPHDDGYGARCGLGDPGFATWTCGAALRCTPISDDDVGTCLPEGGPLIGDACERGPIAPVSNAHRDTARLGPRDACAGQRPCERNAVGFPGGMCAGGCGDLPEGAVCGGIPLLAEFNACLAAGVAFGRCIQDHTRPGALRSCSFRSPCRDDYICARSGDGGVCLPPYFLFQLRVDGHPL
jgi:hypothetical protein